MLPLSKMHSVLGCVSSIPYGNRLAFISALLKLVILCVARLLEFHLYYSGYITANKTFTDRFPWQRTRTNGKVQGNVNRKDKAESISDEIGMQPSQKQLL